MSGSRETEGIRRGGGGGSEGGGRSEAETLLQPARAEKKIITTNNIVKPAYGRKPKLYGSLTVSSRQ